MVTHSEVMDFLSRNPALSISTLEAEARLPKSTLAKATAGDRVLNAKHLAALYPVLAKYGFREKVTTEARIISVVNHKGGVGKTTTVINLGCAMARLGKKVLVVDIDPQGNLSQALGIDNPERQLVHTLLHKEPLPVVPVHANLDLAPSDLELAFADLELVQTVGGMNRLKNALRPLRKSYDYILIDCPPALNIFTNSALVASQGCLITLQPEASAMKGLNKLFDRIYEVQEDINYELHVEGIVFTMVDRRLKVHQDMMDDVNQTLRHFRVFNSFIRLNVTIKESQVAQQDIFTYDENSNGAMDHHHLAKELLAS